MDLFQTAREREAPLADRMRPNTLDEFIGQSHIVGPGKLLRRAIEADRLTSCIFYGPPGCGKTALANVIAHATKSAFVRLNAVTSGVKECREMLDEAEKRLSLYGQPTYLLLDECHRWNKAQSDSILPALEKGTVRFIGSTTENPMIAMTPAIVSRCRVFQFHALSVDEVSLALRRALLDPVRGFGQLKVNLLPEAMEHIAFIANGDVRSALGALELAVLTTTPNAEGVIVVDRAVAEESIQSRALQMDETLYYDMLSAFCKSLRGSDSTAALAWAARLIHAGVDPRIIARRLIAHASEDIGMANPTAMQQAVAAAQALEMVGLPEARLSLAQAIIYLCESPKSNSVVMAIDEAFADVEGTLHTPVPVHLRDTHYQGAEKLGNGVGYRYPHEFPGHYVKQQYRPVSVERKEYYRPSSQGFEQRVRLIRQARGQYVPPEE